MRWHELLCSGLCAAAGLLAGALLAAPSSNADAAPLTLPDLPACGQGVSATVCKAPLPGSVARSMPDNPSVTVRSASGTLDILIRTAPGSQFTFAERPFVCCDIQGFAERLGSERWGLRVRVPRLSEAALRISVANLDGSHGLSSAVFRGPQARQTIVDEGPLKHQLRGVAHESFVSAALGAPRGLTIYRGERCRESLSHCQVFYVADGGNIDRFLASGPNGAEQTLAAIVLVGIQDPPDEDFGSRRSGELLPGFNRDLFEHFQNFVLGELIAHVEGAERVPSGQRFLFGMSDGATWAINLAQSEPALFAGAIAFSVPRSPISTPTGQGSYLIGAGTFEPVFQTTTERAAAALRSSGARVEERYVVGGHSLTTWNTLFWWAMERSGADRNHHTRRRGRG